MLNDRQKEAVQADHRALLIVAGPGTGKTRVFAHRAARLLREENVPPRNLLALTFTRAAAREMRDRLRALLKGSPAAPALDGLWVDTFHAAALKILRERGHPFGPGVPFEIIPEEDKPALLEGLLPRKEAGAFLEKVRRQKQALSLPAEGPAAEYQRRLLDSKRLDHDDLFVYVHRLFDERPETLEEYRRRFQHILADEFQDTTPAQYSLLRRLAAGAVCVIGDPDQSIYGFAGGGFRPFERFKKDFPDHRVLSLSENHRSQAVILEAARQVIRRNRADLPRELTAKLEKGLPIDVSAHATDREEAEMVAKKIEGLLGGASYFTIDSRWAEKERETYAYGLRDMAVLYRLHAQAGKIREALERTGLPVKVFGRTPAREEGADGDREDFQDDAEGIPPGEAVTLMTLHRSKGLEFPVVFIAGCEEGLLPFRREGESLSEEGMEEERRLFYVGMTRAKNRLFLSHARKRALFGKIREARPSPFLRDIEEELRVLREREAARKTPPKPRQGTLF